MPKRSKASRDQGNHLIAIYDRVTCLDTITADMKTAELETLSAEIYNAIVPVLNPKRKVLLNELLDIEVELRVRNNAKE
jgi:hypothetical protein